MSKLREKITSKEQLEAALAEVFYSGAENYRRREREFSATFWNLGEPAWWAVREYCRKVDGVYEITNALDKVRPLIVNLHAHVSLDDPKMIAYTPDKQAGEADRQIRIAPGRFFSKFLPIMSENFIRTLTEEHIAELSDEVEFLEGEQIVEAYMNFSRGVGACMTNEKFARKDHPTWVYATEKVKLAVVRDKESKIIARTLVYEPAEDDKRYIRLYGAPVLEKRLKRKGYKAGTLVGAKLNIKKVEEQGPQDTVMVLMPYIDGNGQAGSERWSNVALIDGELKVISQELANKLKKLDKTNTVTALSTTGFAILKPVDTSGFKAVCAISGEPINLLEPNDRAVYTVLLQQDKLEKAYASAVTEHGEGALRRMWDGDKYIYVHPSQVLTIGGRDYPNHKRILLDNGLAKLDAGLYPDAQGWQRYQDVIFTEDGKTIMKQDAIRLVFSQGDGVAGVKIIHKSELPKKVVKIHSTRTGIQNYAEAQVEILKTHSGRKVHRLVNGISKLITGEWEFDSKVATTSFCGVYVNLHKEVSRNLNLVDDRTMDAIWEKITDGAEGSDAIITAILRIMRVASLYNVPYVTRQTFTAYAEKASLKSLVDYCGLVSTSLNGSYYSSSYRLMIRMLEKYPARVLAEAEAVEAPHRLTDAAIEVPTVQVIGSQEAVAA